MRFPAPGTQVLIGSAFLVAVLGAWRMLAPLPDAHIVHAGSGTITLEGKIVSAPEITDTSIAYVVGHLTHSGAALGGRILVRDRRMWPRYRYGEKVRLTGRLEIAGDAPYDRSLRARGVHATMFGPGIAQLATAPWSVLGLLITIREAIEGTIRQLLPEPAASLAVGLLTGTRASFPPELTQALRISGLTHITAVSGSNVAIILMVLEHLFFWIPRRFKLMPLLGGLVLFTLFTGASASVVRAAIMGGLSVLALHAGRMADARRTIAWTACAMLLLNPWLLPYDLGFQLSFLSVLGILEISPRIEPFLRWIPRALALRESIILTLSSHLLAAPWIAYTLGTVSLISLPANVLAAPLIPVSMLLGALTILLWPVGLALPMAFVAMIPLKLIIIVSTISASVPFAAIQNIAIPPWTVALYYGAAILLLRTPTRRNTPHRCLGTVQGVHQPT